MSVIQITNENFKEEVISSDKPVLLDFWAGWCGPCRMLSPLVDEIAQENSNIKVGKVCVDEQPELAQAFGVDSIPALFVVKGGKITAKSVGAVPKSEILKLIGQ